MPIIVTLPLIRYKRKLTQEELAELSKRSQQLIGKLEQGKAKGVGFDTLCQLCEAVGATSIEEVVAYIPEDPRKLDETLAMLSKRLDCSINDILPYVPDCLKEGYRRAFAL